MNILITNDDGIYSDGIIKLAKELSKKYNIVVVAPDRERSATGHAITMHHPLRVNKIDIYNKYFEAYSVDGTPSDCVKIAVETILDFKPNFIISGINNGPNLGTDVIYSGTVSAAIEGAIHDIPSIALSMYTKTSDINYEGAIYYTCKLIDFLNSRKLPKNIVFNVNIPSENYKKIKGIMFTKLGIRKYKSNYVKRIDPFGRTYYWLSGSLLDIKNSNESDIETVMNNYVSITPLHFDLTDYTFLQEMKNWNFNL